MSASLILNTWLSSINLVAGAGTLSIRRIIISITFAVMALRYIQVRRKHRKITTEEEKQRIEELYEKDENGLYPWEADTDDSPNRVTPESKPLVNKWGPKRGRW